MKRVKLPQPIAATLRSPEEFIEESLSNLRASVERSVKDVTAYAQRNPERALLWAAGSGFLLRTLPLPRILCALICFLLALLKPAALIYGAAKILEKAKPLPARRNPPSSR